MTEEYYTPMTPKLRQAANRAIDDCMDQLNTCEGNAFVNAYRIAYRASRNLLNALPDGYPVPIKRNGGKNG